ncbi:MAG: hypothetical protein ACRC6I_05835 [Paracoccaceae bacterium]
MGYRPRVLFEASEQTLKNLMRGPLVEVTEDRRMLYATRRFRSNKTGFQKYAHLFSDYACSSLEVISNDMAEGRYYESFDIDFEAVPAERISELFLGGITRFPEDLDYSVFSKMTNVTQLITDTLSYKTNLAQLFPRLEAFLNFDWKSNRIKTLGNSWPDLKYLHIQGFNDSLSLFAGRDLRRIFLVGGSLTSLEDLALFPNLDTLFISGLRKEVDISPISKLPALRNLTIQGKPKFTRWDSFASPTVQILELETAPADDIFDRFPALKHGSIGKTPQERYGIERAWDMTMFEYPFSFVVPTQPVS